jgi:class 3 adenylate cyclase
MVTETKNTDEEQVRQPTEQDIFKRQYLKMRSNYENKIQELSIIKELVDTLRLTGISDRKTLFSEQLKIIKKYSPLQHVALMLLNEDLQMLEVIVSDNDKEKAADSAFVSLDEGTYGQVMTQGKPVIIDDIARFCSPADREKLKGQSLLCVPVTHNNKAIGVLSLTHHNKNAFDQNQVSFFSLVADQMATAVVLSRLYTQMLKEENKRFLLSRFFSKSVTDEILGSKGLLHLGGERKRATIVFADLQGFTAMSERLDQEKVVDILNEFFSHMTPIIFRHEGTLDKLLGDGMMAVFGAPISRDDDPVRALKTVIEMMQSLRTFNEMMRNKDWPELRMGIGVNTGDVVAGYIGSEDHLNYTVIGDAVNVAHRVESLAKQNEVLITRTVMEAIEGRHAEVAGLKGLTQLPSQKVKGKKKPVDIYRVEY